MDAIGRGDTLNFVDLLRTLGIERPVFHSEADFQHSLAWLIHQRHPAAAIRLEVPRMINGRRVHVDVWVGDNRERVAVELKYLTRAVETTAAGESFRLLDQAAQDLGRYDILKDLWRVESLVSEGAADRGVVIALTNDSAYWSGPRALSSPNYEAFRLFDGRELHGVMNWGPLTGAGTMRGREAPISLRGTYRCTWTGYSDLTPEVKRGHFRYLLFEVHGTSP